MRLRILWATLLSLLLSASTIISFGCSRAPASLSTSVDDTDSAPLKVAKLDKQTVPSGVPQPSAEPAGYEFAEPVRIKAGGDFVSVESPGYACPTITDVDGDGKEDLVVGQFRSGHMQFCRNVSAKGEKPKFAAPEWIMTGEDRAEVPGVW